MPGWYGQAPRVHLSMQDRQLAGWRRPCWGGAACEGATVQLEPSLSGALCRADLGLALKPSSNFSVWQVIQYTVKTRRKMKQQAEQSGRQACTGNKRFSRDEGAQGNGQKKFRSGCVCTHGASFCIHHLGLGTAATPVVPGGHPSGHHPSYSSIASPSAPPPGSSSSMVTEGAGPTSVTMAMRLLMSAGRWAHGTPQSSAHSS